jgi:hypothetical protein
MIRDISKIWQLTHIEWNEGHQVILQSTLSIRKSRVSHDFYRVNTMLYSKMKRQDRKCQTEIGRDVVKVKDPD